MRLFIASPSYSNDFLGYVSWIGKYAERDAVLTELLYECGAVPFVRTNVPQTLMVLHDSSYRMFYFDLSRYLVAGDL